MVRKGIRVISLIVIVAALIMGNVLGSAEEVRAEEVETIIYILAEGEGCAAEFCAERRCESFPCNWPEQYESCHASTTSARYASTGDALCAVLGQELIINSWAGYRIHRMGMFFDTTNLTEFYPDIEVLGAQLRFWCDGDESWTRDFDIVVLDGSGTLDSTLGLVEWDCIEGEDTVNYQRLRNMTTSMGSMNTVDIAVSAYNYITLTPTGVDLINNQIQSNQPIRLGLRSGLDIAQSAPYTNGEVICIRVGTGAGALVPCLVLHIRYVHDGGGGNGGGGNGGGGNGGGGNGGLLLPPRNLVATPVTGNEIYLTWLQPNAPELFPGAVTHIRMEVWEYPDDPPSSVDGSTLIYYASMGSQGTHSYTVYGVSPGTTYYFRIWFEHDGAFTTYAEDFCTPYAGEIVPPEVRRDAPRNWFLEPTCDSWKNVPLAMNIIEGIEDDFGMPQKTLCLWINLFLLACAMTVSYGARGIVSGEWTGTGTILVPFMVMCAGFIIGPLVGAFPGFFLLFGVLIGLGIAYAWVRA